MEEVKQHNASSSNTDANQQCRWYVLRDLKRHNAKYPAYKMLADEGFNVFTPMKWIITTRRGKRVRLHVPVLTDLLFVNSTYDLLTPLLELEPTVQYRYLRGGYCKPMTVSDAEMNNFIKASTAGDQPIYFLPSELTSLSIGKTVCIEGGPFEGIEGKIVKIKGARRKRVMVELPGFIAAVIEVETQYLKLID